MTDRRLDLIVIGCGSVNIQFAVSVDQQSFGIGASGSKFHPVRHIGFQVNRIVGVHQPVGIIVTEEVIQFPLKKNEKLLRIVELEFPR